MIKYLDQAGAFNTFAPTQSDFVNARLLGASTAETTTIPAGAKFVVMTASVLSYFRIGTATATIPGDTTDGSASDSLQAGVPVIRNLGGAKTNGSITTGTAALTVLSTEGMTIGDTLVVTGAGVAGADLTQTISAIDQTTSIVTLGGNASTTVSNAAVTETVSGISVISAGTPTITFAYYK